MDDGMIFTKEHLNMVKQWALWRTSKSLGLTNDDDLVPADAVKVISDSKGHKAALDEVAESYEAWYAFHLKIYKAGKSGSLSPEENEELIKLIDRRENSKEALLAITPV
jgi:hypothetical protein